MNSIGGDRGVRLRLKNAAGRAYELQATPFLLCLTPMQR